MGRFKNVMVIINPLENVVSVLRRALELASLQNARITLFDILRDLPRDPNLAETTPEKIKQYHEKRSEQIKELIDATEYPGTPEVNVLMGVSYIETLGQVSRGEHDLLVKPADSNGTQDTSSSKTDVDLLRSCPIPLLIVKPGKHKKCKKVMAAIDPKPTVYNADLNKKILDTAAMLAEREQASLHIVSVWKLNYETELRSRVGGADNLFDELESAHKEWLTELTRPYVQNGESIELHLIKGRNRVYKDICNEAINNNVDMLVMGTLGRSGIPGFLFGNTAERVLSRIKCSLLAIKPNGFRTPAEA